MVTGRAGHLLAWETVAWRHRAQAAEAQATGEIERLQKDAIKEFRQSEPNAMHLRQELALKAESLEREARSYTEAQ